MKTTDYKLFKINKLNRIVQTGHIEKLKKSIEKVGYLKYNPIIVNEDMEIIDGQHRYFACVKLNLPIYYEVETWDINDIMVELNSTQKWWTLTDFIDHHAEAGIEWYINFNKFKEKYKFNQTATLSILTGHKNWAGKIIKNGDSFEEIKYANYIAQTVCEFRELFDFAMSKTFIRALIKVYIKWGHREVKKLLNRWIRIKKQVNVMDYCIVFENILNKGRATRNYISL